MQTVTLPEVNSPRRIELATRPDVGGSVFMTAYRDDGQETGCWEVDRAALYVAARDLLGLVDPLDALLPEDGTA